MSRRLQGLYDIALITKDDELLTREEMLDIAKRLTNYPDGDSVERAIEELDGTDAELKFRSAFTPMEMGLRLMDVLDCYGKILLADMVYTWPYDWHPDRITIYSDGRTVAYKANIDWTEMKVN